MHIVHGELRKAPFIKSGCGQDQQSTMFIIELSEMIKDSRTGEKTYTNYSACLFAKSPAHIAHYQNTLVEGNFVVVTGEKLKVDVSECKQYIKLQIENARLEGSGYIGQSNNDQKYQQAQQQGYQQAPQQQAPQRQQGQSNSQGFKADGQQYGGQQNNQFDDDIPW